MLREMFGSIEPVSHCISLHGRSFHCYKLDRSIKCLDCQPLVKVGPTSVALRLRGFPNLHLSMSQTCLMINSSNVSGKPT